MKNKKGEIATFLTLGLVIVGAVVTLATSFFTNQKKNIASNPRAYSVRTSGSQPSSSQATLTITLTLTITPSPTKTSTPGSTNNSCKIGEKCGSGYAHICSPNSTKVPFNGIEFDGNGCDPTRCPKKELPFACYVVDNRCRDGEIRYRWYGCTGKPCEETNIKQGTYGPGHLVGKPVGGNTQNLVEECVSIDLIQNTPTPTPTSTPTPTPTPTSTPIPRGEIPSSATSASGGATLPSPTLASLNCIEPNDINFSGTDFKIERNKRFKCDELIYTKSLDNNNLLRIFTYCLKDDDNCHYRCFYNDIRIDCWGFFKNSTRLGFNVGTQIQYGPDDTLLYLINNLGGEIIIKKISGFKKSFLPGVKTFDYINQNISLSDGGFYIKKIEGDASCGHIGGYKERIVIDNIMYCIDDNNCISLPPEPVEYDCESGGTNIIYVLRQNTWKKNLSLK